MDTFEELFTRKTHEASVIIAEKNRKENEISIPIPFEVNKVLHKIDDLTEKRKKLFKRK